MKNVTRILAVLLALCMLVAMPVAAAGATDTTGGTVDLEPSAATGVAGSYIEYFEKNYDVKKVVSHQIPADNCIFEQFCGIQQQIKALGIAQIACESDIEIAVIVARGFYQLAKPRGFAKLRPKGELFFGDTVSLDNVVNKTA